MATHKQAVCMLYFLAFAAMACAGRFMALFFRDDLGLSAGYSHAATLHETEP